jgi:hypothetical protein
MSDVMVFYRISVRLDSGRFRIADQQPVNPNSPFDPFLSHIFP